MKPELQSLYRETLLKHSREPLNREPMPEADVTEQIKNPLCGDIINLHLRFNHDQITHATFEAQCCSICMASASMLTEKVGGSAQEESKSFARSLIDLLKDSKDSLALSENEDLIALSGVKEFPSRIRCATLPWEALLAALAGRVNDE